MELVVDGMAPVKMSRKRFIFDAGYLKSTPQSEVSQTGAASAPTLCRVNPLKRVVRRMASVAEFLRSDIVRATRPANIGQRSGRTV